MFRFPLFRGLVNFLCAHPVIHHGFWFEIGAPVLLALNVAILFGIYFKWIAQ